MFMEKEGQPDEDQLPPQRRLARLVVLYRPAKPLWPGEFSGPQRFPHPPMALLPREMTVTARKRRRGKRNPKPKQGRGQQHADTRDTPPDSHGSTSYRPRDGDPPVDITDAIDRHVSRATETDELLQRYLRLLRFGRTTVLLIVLTILIFVAGVGVAVVYAGLDPMETLGFGLGGSGVFILTAILVLRRGLKAGVDMLDRAVEAARDEALEPRDEIAD